MTKPVPIARGPAPATITAPQSEDRSMEARWQYPELFKKGFLPVPFGFMEHYSRLKPYPLTTGEAMFVLHLMRFKWSAKAPFPGYKRLGAHMGISHKMARTHAKSLEDKKLLRRLMRIGRTNRFDLTPLFAALAKAVADERPGRRLQVATD